MSALRFGNEAVRTWADYSGDFNPIHFDERIAEAAIGKGGTVVHGMLAMMPLKASQSAQSWEGDGWLHWTAMLRRAMPQSFGYAMESLIAQPGRKVRFKLSALDDAEAKITGHCSVVDFDPPPYAGFLRVEVDPAEAQAELLRFSNSFPDISPAWIAIDAMVFSRYIRLHAEAVFREALTCRFGEGGPDVVATGEVITMQTVHTDTFDRSLLADLKDISITSFAYAYAKTDELPSNNSLFATVDIPVWINGALVQVVQIGLMARKLSSFPKPRSFA